MAYVFGITGGTAQKLLDPLYLTSSPYALTTSQQMIDHLATCFENGQEKADARDAYSTLSQSKQESFQSFRVRFMDIASRAEIPEDTQLDDIFRKIRPELQASLLTDRRRWKSLWQAIQEIDALDKERTSFLLRNQQRTPPARAPLASAAYTPRMLPAPPGPLAPIVQRAAVPTLPGRNTTPLRHGTPAPRIQSTVPEVRTCYNCGQVGHLSTDCTAPRKERSLQELEADSEETEQLVGDESEQESESGNEDA
jgi:hypothetical protein